MSGVRIRSEGRAGRITLARPQALNALDALTVREMASAFAQFLADPQIRLILIDAEGARAFCAGGDLRELYDLVRSDRSATASGFWAGEYRLNRQIAECRKPVVALMQGIVLGGGVGLGCHAGHRVVGETTQMALPECGIGLVPDVGSTDLLARTPGRLGEFLGLTGHRMGPGDAIAAGFADHFVPEAAWPDLTDHLMRSGDPGQITTFAQAAPEPMLPALADRIDDAFAAPDLDHLAARLETSDWGRGVLETLSARSPLSMACTLQLVRAARAAPGVAEALVREHRFTRRALEVGELLEGIRAAVIDKDRNPRWRHGLGDVPETEVAAMLAPLGSDELTFPDRPQDRSNGGE